MEVGDKKVVVWDGDNTLWDWMGYAVPAYTAMRDAIAILARKSPEETAAAMKTFYAKMGTVERENLVQDLHENGFFSDNPDFNLKEAAKDIQRIFSTVRRENLKLYPAIADTVQRIHDKGCLQVVLTDAPGNQAAARLKHFGLNPYFDEVYAMPSGPLPKHAPTKGFVHTSYTVDVEKPHSDLAKILEMTNEEIAKRVVIVGDNKAKDMALAERWGARGIHAVYGNSPWELVKEFLQFAPDRVAGRNVQVSSQTPLTPAEPSRILVAESPKQIFRLVFEI